MERPDTLRVRISKEERRDLERLAAQERKTVSEIVREAINRRIRDSKEGKAA